MSSYEQADKQLAMDKDNASCYFVPDWQSVCLLLCSWDWKKVRHVWAVQIWEVAQLQAAIQICLIWRGFEYSQSSFAWHLTSSSLLFLDPFYHDHHEDMARLGNCSCCLSLLTSINYCSNNNIKMRTKCLLFVHWLSSSWAPPLSSKLLVSFLKEEGLNWHMSNGRPRCLNLSIQA